MALLAVVLIVAAAVVVAPGAVRVMDRAAGWPLAALLFTAAGILFAHVPAINDGQPLTYDKPWVPETNIMFALRADGLGVFFALLALIIGGVVFIYSTAYLPKREGNTSFYTIMTAFTLSIVLLVLADDVVLLFIAWELVSMASFMLIARSGSGGQAGSIRTLVLTFFGGLTLLAAISLAATATHTTRLSEILSSPMWHDRPGFTALVAILIALSAFTKSAQFPFHFWLPEAMAAATPVSAFLHAAAVVKAGIYVLLRFSTIFHDVAAWNWMLMVVGMFTATMSALFAIQKTDLKQITAYSTVSHLGWIVTTIGVGTPFALAAAVVHTLAHALFKSSLFMLIGVIDHEAGSRDIRRLGPLYKQMPFTFASVIIAAASMAAVPPLFGFVSKEGMLTAYEGKPILLIVAGIAALLTFTYSAKIVFGAFVDGPRDVSRVHEAPARFWIPAALPGWMSLFILFFFPLIDGYISGAVHAITGSDAYESELKIFHGLNVSLLISVLVLAAGVVVVLQRKKVFAAMESFHALPFDGNAALRAMLIAFTKLGKAFGSMADTLNPSRHMLWMILLVLALTGATFTTTGADGVHLAPRTPGLDNPWDLIPLAIITGSVIGMVLTRKRLTTAVLLGTTGVGVSLQMLMLGAPDVALTQFLVEALTVIVIMMVLRYQPMSFPRTSSRRKAWSAVVAVCVGVAAFAGTYGLLGRRGKSELANYFIDNAHDLTSANNVVAVIIVEFRGFDTMGELSVLGMAAVVISALVTTMPRYPFRKGTHPRPFGQSQLNSVPMKKAYKLLLPVIVILSLLTFMRGHTSPGGGFIAALILATAFCLSYLSRGADEPVVAERTPMLLTGIGILAAISAGLIGFTKGGFLHAIHGEILGQHLTTSMIFDGGIYLAVLGMFTQAINALGGYLRPGVTDVRELNYSRLGGVPKLDDDIDHDNIEDDFPAPINPAHNPIPVSASTTKEEH